MFALKKIGPKKYRLNVKDGDVEFSWVITENQLKELLEEVS